MNKSPDFRDLMLAGLEQTGMSVAELARRSKVSYDAINKLKRRDGSSTSAENAIAIAKILDFTWQAGGELADHGAHNPYPEQNELVPVYNVDASAGHGAITDWEEEVVDRLAFPPNYLRKITSGRQSDLAIIGVKGDSMTPTLSDNDVVMIDRSKRDLSFDGLFVLRDGGASLLVKRVGRGTRSGTITLISDNRTYRDTERAVEDIEVIGKVVWRGVKE